MSPLHPHGIEIIYSNTISHGNRMTDDVSKSDTQQKGPPSALTAVVELLLRKTMIMLLKGVLSRKPMNGVKARSLGFHGVSEYI